MYMNGKRIGGNITVQFGDSAPSSLVVYYVFGETKVPVTSTQIFEHIQNGGTAVFCRHISDDMFVYYTLLDCRDTLAIFGSMDEDYTGVLFTVNNEGDVEEIDMLYASASRLSEVEDIIGNIETALDSIIAIQESLIGGAAE